MAAQLAGVEPHFLTNAQALLAEAGGKIWIVSAFRTYQEQVRAYQHYLNGGAIAAKPGSSKHEFGLAIDFGGDMKLLALLAPAYLMIRTVPSEDWHYEPLWSRNRGITPRFASGAGSAAPSAPLPKGDTVYFLKDINAQNNQPTFFHEVTGLQWRQLGQHDQGYIDQHRASGVTVVALSDANLKAHLRNLDAQRAKFAAQVAAAG